MLTPTSVENPSVDSITQKHNRLLDRPPPSDPTWKHSGPDASNSAADLVNILKSEEVNNLFYKIRSLDRLIQHVVDCDNGVPNSYFEQCALSAALSGDYARAADLYELRIRELETAGKKFAQDVFVDNRARLQTVIEALRIPDISLVFSILADFRGAWANNWGVRKYLATDDLPPRSA